MPNPIDLAGQARRAGKRKTGIVTAPVIQPTRSQERDLARLYMPVIRIWSESIRTRILPEYRRTLEQRQVTDSADDIRVEVDRTFGETLRAILSFESLFANWSSSVQQWHLKQFVSSIKYKTNVDLSTQMGAGEVTETMNDILNRNVSLIRNISEQERSRIADIVFRGLQNRTPPREVAKELTQVTKLARARALRIAQDQLLKLSSALDKERQLQVGMDSFKWRHSGKVHYRPWHKARNGKIYSWNSKVAKDDPPGYAPFCGCKAEGILNLDDD